MVYDDLSLTGYISIKTERIAVMSEVSELYYELIARDLFTEDELNLVTSINGWSVETLNDCLYARYAYHNIEEMGY